MNNSDKLKEDILYQFLNPEKIEKTPQGFTEKLLNRIQFENVSSVGTKWDYKNIKVPLISGLVIVTLIISALLLPSTDKNSILFSELNSLKNISIAFPDNIFKNLTSFVVPGWTIYIPIGIFVLAAFDKALSTFFNRERN
jgi:hypothetical protein